MSLDTIFIILFGVLLYDAVDFRCFGKTFKKMQYPNGNKIRTYQSRVWVIDSEIAWFVKCMSSEDNGKKINVSR